MVKKNMFIGAEIISSGFTLFILLFLYPDKFWKHNDGDWETRMSKVVLETLRSLNIKWPALKTEKFLK
jgi:hypothetical protein